MKKMQKSITIIFILLLCLLVIEAGCQAEPQEEKPPSSLKVTVDPRVELVSIIFYLAGNPEYNKCRIPGYLKDVDQHFGSFRDHEVVSYASSLRSNNGVSYNAPMDVAVRVSDTGEFKEKISFEPLPENMDRRWTPECARTFSNAAKSFAADTDFEKFFAEHSSLYDEVTGRMEDLLAGENIESWLKGFYGKKSTANFTVIIGMLTGGHCYGAQLEKNDSGEAEFYCIMGVWKKDLKGIPRFDKSFIPFIVHEFCHSYVNPLVVKHSSELQAPGEKIYGSVEEQMRSMAYTDWKIMMFEYMVRASVIRFIRAHDGEKAAQSKIKEEKNNGFKHIEGLTGLLGEYEAQRDTYPDLDSFFPKIVEFFQGCAAPGQGEN